MSRLSLLAAALLATAIPVSALPAQSMPDIDPVLAHLIATTKAIDNHAHPVLPPAPNTTADRNFDALPVDDMVPQTDPLALRPDYPALREAWQALYHFTSPTLPLTAREQDRLEAARAAAKTREGSHYANWVLDQAGIGTMLANRVALGVGIAAPRFAWVPYIDALVFPLDNTTLAAATPDRAQFFALEDKLRARYLAEANLQSLPPTLDAYLSQVVFPTLARHKAAGAIAEKFEIAYLRSFDFSDPPRATVEQVYARALTTRTAPTIAEYQLLQDFLFRQIAIECGRLNLPVHLHAMAGAGSYFSIAGGNPLLLEPLFNDPRLRKTTFVLLHGGWPFLRETGALLQKPNVYLDISQQSLVFPAHTLATWLREWLETYPDKILFATDGYPYTAALGWEESTWLAARNARQALALALTAMQRDHEITPARAADLARMVLRTNAATLYHLSNLP